jgi:phosphoribosylaminoimidazole-succinocarboxamide synthase
LRKFGIPEGRVRGWIKEDELRLFVEQVDDAVAFDRKKKARRPEPRGRIF